MTIGELCKGKSTLDQFDILMRADVLFGPNESRVTENGLVTWPGVGRYFGGLLLTEEIAALTPVKPERKKHGD